MVPAATIVAVPMASRSVAWLGDVRRSSNDSAGSASASVRTVTGMAAAVAPGGNVTVPAVAT